MSVAIWCGVGAGLLAPPEKLARLPGLPGARSAERSVCRALGLRDLAFGVAPLRAQSPKVRQRRLRMFAGVAAIGVLGLLGLRRRLGDSALVPLVTMSAAASLLALLGANACEQTR